MHGEKLTTNMQVMGYRTRQMKPSPQAETTETVLEVELESDLTRALAKKLGSQVERLFVADPAPDAADPNGAPAADIDGTVRPHVDGRKEPYQVTVSILGKGNGGAKTCSFRQQATDSVRIKLGDEPLLCLRLLAEHDERTLAFLRENVRQGVKIEFKAAQQRLC